MRRAAPVTRTTGRSFADIMSLVPGSLCMHVLARLPARHRPRARPRRAGLCWPPNPERAADGSGGPARSATRPEPDADERAHSADLAALIRNESTAAGAMPFARYMELALYAPSLGYYSAGRTKFGAAGDFITAPEL